VKSDKRIRAHEYAILALLLLIILGLLANALLTARVMVKLEVLAMTRGSSTSLPCPAIPTRFVMEEPACAQKLLESMNVTNVRVTAVRKALPPSGSGVAAP
jgi:hypothetical protein